MRRAALWLGGAVALVALTAGLMWLTTAQSASFRVAGDRITVSGVLTLASTDRLERLLEDTPGLAVLEIGAVRVDGPVTALLQKGALLRRAGLATEVAAGVTLTGDAVYLFLAGDPRRLGPGAGLAVADWMTPLGPASALPADHPAHEERRAYLRTMLGSEDLYWLALRAGATPVPLDAATLRRLGIAG